jgi:succinyl-CoA synthetase beta subunit
MKLFEFEAKDILRKYGILTPQGNVVTEPEEARAIAERLGKPAVLKSQILVSGRGKAGGIAFVNDAAEAEKTASKLLGSTIKGCSVGRLLIEEKMEIAAQFYAVITIDRGAKTYIALASTSGGVDIEEIAKTSPEEISRYWIDIATGFSSQNALDMLRQFSLNKGEATGFANALHTLYTIAMNYDAELIEINPLVKTSLGELMAADARIMVDDNAIFRHPELADRSLLRAEDTPREAEARKQGLTYVDLDGDIGIVGNGAGLVMATIDLVQLFGGKPGNFLDLGGGGQIESTKEGIMLVMAKPEIKTVLINVLGGITRCDIVAEAIIQATSESGRKKPLTVRLTGTNEEKAVQMLRRAGISTYQSMEEAIKEVVKLGRLSS